VTSISPAARGPRAPFLYVETSLAPGTTLPERRAALPGTKPHLIERLKTELASQLLLDRRRPVNH
jgi:hypothetical protein